MLSPVHLPLDHRIFYKEAKSLQKYGHDVTVVAQSEEAFESIEDNIRIIAVKRASKKLFHPITIMRVLIKGWKCDCDVYHCHEPGSLFAGIILKIFKGSKLVYDAHEYYPHLISTNSIFPSSVQSLIEKLANIEEIFLCRFPNSIITVNHVLAKHYSEINDNVHIISNYPYFQAVLTNVRKFDNPLIAYVGTITRERGIFELLLAYEDVVKKVPQARLLIIGGFIDKDFELSLKKYVKENCLAGVEITGHLPYNIAMDRLADVTIGVAVLQPIEAYIKAVPVKLFEYMMYGIPVIISDFPFIREIVEFSECGLLVDPTNIGQISEALLSLINNPELEFEMSKNGRKAVEEKYNWDEMEKLLLKIYENLG